MNATTTTASAPPPMKVCPNCGSTDIKFHTGQYDCRTCRPLGYIYPVGTDIDRDDHRHYSCRNGHRWADPS